MRWTLVLLVVALAACRDTAPPQPQRAAGDIGHWVMPTGKAPSKAEFAALVAACEDRTLELQPCLGDYGMRPAP